MSENTVITDERAAELKARPIDYSDIPKITRASLAGCMVRFRNQPPEKGGSWHKITQSDNISDQVCKESLELVN